MTSDSVSSDHHHHLKQHQEAPGWSRHPLPATRQAYVEPSKHSKRLSAVEPPFPRAASESTKAKAVSRMKATANGDSDPTCGSTGTVAASSERERSRRDTASRVDNKRDAGHDRPAAKTGDASPRAEGDGSTCALSKRLQESGKLPVPSRPPPPPGNPPPHLARRTSHRETTRNARYECAIDNGLQGRSTWSLQCQKNKRTEALTCTPYYKALHALQAYAMIRRLPYEHEYKTIVYTHALVSVPRQTMYSYSVWLSPCSPGIPIYGGDVHFA